MKNHINIIFDVIKEIPVFLIYAIYVPVIYYAAPDLFEFTAWLIFIAQFMLVAVIGSQALYSKTVDSLVEKYKQLVSNYEDRIWSDTEQIELALKILRATEEDDSMVVTILAGMRARNIDLINSDKVRKNQMEFEKTAYEH